MEDKEIYTTLSLEEVIWNLKVLIVMIKEDRDGVVDARNLVSKLEALVGQKHNDDGTWCPPNCEEKIQPTINS